MRLSRHKISSLLNQLYVKLLKELKPFFAFTDSESLYHDSLDSHACAKNQWLPLDACMYGMPRYPYMADFMAKNSHNSIMESNETYDMH